MPEKTAISTDLAPAPFGAYSQAIKMENTIYISAQYPIDVKTGRLVGADPSEQCAQVFQNLTQILQFAGAQLSNILTMNIYIVDFNDLRALEAVSQKHFFFLPPARTLIPVPWLPYGARFAADAIAQIVPVKTEGAGKLF